MKDLIRLFCSGFIILLLPAYLFSQTDSSKVDFDGYISNMQSAQFEDPKGNWINDNLLHNRLNFKWLPNDKFTVGLGLRNRLFTGETVKLTPDYGDYISSSETGFFNLSWNIINEQSVVLNMNIDRLFVEYSGNKFSASIGRQRINWGKTFVWNPNDIFNAYSYFDFDYIERPGSDAIRIQFFPSAISSLEMAMKIDADDNFTTAAMWRFNLKEYDFQMLAGILNSSDYVIGTGWSGAIKGIDFKGELSYFQPIKNFSDTTGLFTGSVSLSYAFPNTLNLMMEFLYTDIPEGISLNYFDMYTGQLTVKNLSIAEYNLFGQIGYQITPLLNGSLAGIYYPDIHGYFIGPSIDYSLTDNLFASFIVQKFGGEVYNPFTLQHEFRTLTMAFLRIKLNF